MTTKLFTTKEIQKYFNILHRLKRESCNWYKGYYTNNSDYAPCQQDIFIHRTINKWFKNKYFILYDVDENSNLQYKKYIQVLSIHFGYGYGDDFRVYYYDYSRPSKLLNSIIIDHNKALSLEGEWCKDNKEHLQILKMCTLNIPEKEFIIEIFDWNKYPKRVRKGTDPMDKIKGTLSIKAKTYHEFYNKKLSLFEKEYKGTRIIFGDIIEIKDINNEKI